MLYYHQRTFNGIAKNVVKATDTIQGWQPNKIKALDECYKSAKKEMDDGLVKNSGIRLSKHYILR